MRRGEGLYVSFLFFFSFFPFFSPFLVGVTTLQEINKQQEIEDPGSLRYLSFPFPPRPSLLVLIESQTSQVQFPFPLRPRWTPLSQVVISEN